MFRKYNNKGSVFGTIVIIICALMVLGCAVYIGIGLYKEHELEKKKAELRATATTTQTEIFTWESSTDAASSDASSESADDTDNRMPISSSMKKGPYAKENYVLVHPKKNMSTVEYSPAEILSQEYINTIIAKYDTVEEAYEEELNDLLDYSVYLDTASDAIDPVMPGDKDEETYKKLYSTNMVLIDVDNHTIVAERSADERISPASMSKILTVLVASDYIKSLSDSQMITQENIDYAIKKGCSRVGYQNGDYTTIQDLMYGTIVCSGADAAMGLAEYIAGDQETFAELMNEKCVELGIDDTAHFTNAVGLYDDDLRCTVKDIAVILDVAMQNDLCYDALSARTYHCSTFTDAEYDNALERALAQRERENNTDTDTDVDGEEDDKPQGMQIYNKYLCRVDKLPFKGVFIGAKTGYVEESGCCAATYFTSDSGRHYICVTANAGSTWRSIYDHVAVYRAHAK